MEKQDWMKIGIVSLVMIPSVMHLTWAESVGGNPFDLIEKFIGTFYMQMMSVATGLAMLLITAALIKKMVATSPQARAACVSWIIGIVTCWFFIMTLGAWYGWIEPMVNENTYSGDCFVSCDQCPCWDQRRRSG